MKKIVIFTLFAAIFVFPGVSAGYADEAFGFGEVLTAGDIETQDVATTTENMNMPCNAIEIYVENKYPISFEGNYPEDLSDQVVLDDAASAVFQNIECNAIELFVVRTYPIN